MRVALVHDWLVAQRGGENVLVELASLFPHAPIYTLVHEPQTVDSRLEEHSIITSPLERLPGGRRSFRKYLPLFFWAVEQWDLSGFDLIVSTSHCAAKGVRTHRDQVHLSYVHTPARYLYDQLPEYLPKSTRGPVLRAVASALVSPLRAWDRIQAQRPTHILTNSGYVAQRVRRFWGRQAQVVYPPVDVNYFAAARPSKERRGYLVVSALVPYKRVDLAIRWANSVGASLTVVGEGSERQMLEAMAGPTVTFAGPLPRPELRRLYARSRALLFCGVEDFGIVPVEAAAAGCPVVARAEGGALESLTEGVTATFFDGAAVQSLAAAMERFERAGGPGAFPRKRMLAAVRRFGSDRFRAEIKALLASWR